MTTTDAPAGTSLPVVAGRLGDENTALPLAAVEIEAEVGGMVATTTVRQTFRNTHPAAIEATYIFPPPDRAGVTAFTADLAGRRVEGELRERGEARQEYDAAIAAGHRAAISEEERSGVFTTRVGNLQPGEDAVITLTLTGPLAIDDGTAEFRFPLVVAPRYIAGQPLGWQQAGSGTAADIDAVPDASRITPPVLARPGAGMSSSSWTGQAAWGAGRWSRPGGTEMLEPLRAAAALLTGPEPAGTSPDEEARDRFLITDGHAVHAVWPLAGRGLADLSHAHCARRRRVPRAGHGSGRPAGPCRAHLLGPGPRPRP